MSNLSSTREHERIRETMDKEPLEVNYYDLELVEEGKYARECPECDGGILLVRRHLTTFEIVEDDNCIACGRRVKYKDIDKLKNGDFIEN